MQLSVRMSVVVLLCTTLSCQTVGISRERGGYAEVSATVANQMILDNRQIVVLDVRPIEQYAGPLGHIAGSISAPMGSIERQLPELLPYQSSTILVYGDEPEESKLSARLLIAAGFRNVVHIKGGIRQWIDKGYRTVLSP